MISHTTKAAVAAVAAVLMLTGGAAFARESWTPPDDTITGVSGTGDSGFHVIYFGRRDAYLPTVSEAAAECEEYRDGARRIRCRVRVRTWYHDLGATKRAIRYARLDQH